MLKKLFLFIFLLLIILGSAYTATWHYFAATIDREVAKFIENQKQNNIIFDGSISPAHGFPGKYKLVYTGDIISPAGKINVPKLEISGIPLEGQNIFVHTPLGLSIKNRLLPDHLKKLEYAALTFTIPTALPPQFSADYLKIWHIEGNAVINVPSLTLKWVDASIYAETQLRLNKDLQPEGEATLGVTNHTFFLDLIADQIGMPKTQKLMALTFLNALSKENGAVIIPLRLKDNSFYLSMARIGSLPFIHWPDSIGTTSSPFQGRERPDSPPAPPQ